MRALTIGSVLTGVIMLAHVACADERDYAAWTPYRPAPHLVLRQHAPPRPQMPSQDEWPEGGQAVIIESPPGGHQGTGHQGRGHQGTGHQGIGHQGHSLKKDLSYVTGKRAPIPEATTELRQKTPYSYGYFGAIEKRHWSMHFGSRQNFTRWAQR